MKFRARDSVIADNVVTNARDLVVWYSSGNTIRNNHVSGCRYGTHFMYSHKNVVTDNRYRDNVVGIFVMYSHDLELSRNLIAHCRGAAGMGLGIKESGNLQVVENAFLANTTGVYLDSSPLDPAHSNQFDRNQFRMSETAISFHSSSKRNEFTSNSLRDNARQVQVGGGGDAGGGCGP